MRTGAGGKQPKSHGMRLVHPIPTGNGSRRTHTEPDDSVWVLRLYIAGQTSKSLAAFANLKRLCAQHLDNRYRIEVIDLLENPSLAGDDQILAVPMLIRKLPVPVRRIIGDLSNTERVLIGLDLRPATAATLAAGKP